MDILKSVIRDVPDFPKPGILFKDITPVLQNPEAFKAATDGFVERYKDMNLDVIAAIESRGFLFGSTLAHELNVPMALVRKPGKLPCDTVQKSYDLEYGSNTLELHRDAIKEGQRVLVIDDLLATGGTANAAGFLVESLGGKIVEFAFLIELKFLKGDEVLAPHKTFSLIEY